MSPRAQDYCPTCLRPLAKGAPCLDCAKAAKEAELDAEPSIVSMPKKDFEEAWAAHQAVIDGMCAKEPSEEGRQKVLNAYFMTNMIYAEWFLEQTLQRLWRLEMVATQPSESTKKIMQQIRDKFGAES